MSLKIQPPPQSHLSIPPAAIFVMRILRIPASDFRPSPRPVVLVNAIGHTTFWILQMILRDTVFKGQLLKLFSINKCPSQTKKGADG